MRKKVKKEDSLKKSYVAITLVALLVLFGGLSAKADYGLLDRIGDVAGRIYGNFLIDKSSDVEIGELEFGGIQAGEIYGDYFSVGGVDFAHVSSGLNATSSMLCTLSNPFNATSSIEKVTFIANDVFTGGAVTYDISTSSTRHGSSSPALVHSKVMVNTDALAIWEPIMSTSTKIGGLSGTSHVTTLANSIYLDADYFFIKKSEYLNVKVATSTPGNETITGKCTATFRKLGD